MALKKREFTPESSTVDTYDMGEDQATQQIVVPVSQFEFAIGSSL